MTELALVQPQEERVVPLNRVQKISLRALQMTERAYENADYEIAHEWWRAHGRGHLEQYMLSPLGLVVEDGGVPIAMGFVYFTNSFFSQLGWCVTKPGLGPKARTAALVRLYLSAENLARLHGYKAIQMLSDQPTLTKLALGCGWTKMTPHDFLVRSLVEDTDDDV